MNCAHRISRRHAFLVLASAAAVRTVPSLSAIGAAGTSRQPAEAKVRPVPDVVRRLIVEQLAVEEKQVTWEARFVEDLGADSLDTVELTMAVEEEFKIEIPDEAAEKMLRVGDLVEYLRSRKLLK